MSTRTFLAPVATALLALTILAPAAAAVAPAPAASSSAVPANWGPQGLGWGDVVWFASSTRSSSCMALRRDGWTMLANLPWLHRLVVAAPHPAGSVSETARADLLKDWWRFGHDAHAMIKVGNACPATIGARQQLAQTLVGSSIGNTTPAWAHRMFELFAVLYPQSTDASCAALTKNVASAQNDLANGPAKAKYFGRARMTTHPSRWLNLLRTGATCIVAQGGEMEAGVSWGLITLLGSARAEHMHDRQAAATIRKDFN